MRTVRVLSGQALQLAVLTMTVGLGWIGWTVGLAYAVTLDALVARALDGATLGPAGRVTFLRASLVGGVAALVADGFVHTAHVAALVGLTAVALVLDWVDGQVARRTDSVTAFGARFDMEVDAFLIFVLSVYVSVMLAPWVIAIGAARYVYVVAGWTWPALRTPVPPRYWRKVVAAVQGIVLTVAAADLLPRALTLAALACALVLLGESFGRDVWWQATRGPSLVRPTLAHATR